MAGTEPVNTMDYQYVAGSFLGLCGLRQYCYTRSTRVTMLSLQHTHKICAAAAERSMHTATPPQRLCHPCRRAVNGATLCSRQQQHSTPTGAVTSVSSPLFRLSTAIAGLRIARVFNLTLTLTQSIQHIHRFAASTTVSRIDNK